MEVRENLAPIDGFALVHESSWTFLATYGVTLKLESFVSRTIVVQVYF